MTACAQKANNSLTCSSAIVLPPRSLTTMVDAARLASCPNRQEFAAWMEKMATKDRTGSMAKSAVTPRSFSMAETAAAQMEKSPFNQASAANQA